VNPPQTPPPDSYPGLDALELELSLQLMANGHDYHFARQLALDVRMTLEVRTPQYIVVTGIGA
jgi:hypothetical protein